MLLFRRNIYLPISVIILLSCVFFGSAHASLLCESYYGQNHVQNYTQKTKATNTRFILPPAPSQTRNSDLERDLSYTNDYGKLSESLGDSLKEYEKYNFFIRADNSANKNNNKNGRSNRNTEEYLDLYRNPQFLSDVEISLVETMSNQENSIRQEIPKKTETFQKSKNLVYFNLTYGYRSNHSENDNGKEKDIGTIDSLEIDPNGKIKKVTFSDKRQLELFRKHFFGSEFTKKKRDKILKINTELFAYLRNQPLARAKVQEFEKSRGWDEGTAEKIGLVYYSKDVVDLKLWAQERKFSYFEMQDAGWLKAYSSHNKVYFSENYDDSIKIPLYDEQDPKLISSWRTRNLKKRSDLPKYLSWPKDKSLIEEAPLIEEFYNVWNLKKSTGKRIVITEGEFKCAIGSLSTGILHLGLPGITQFNESIRNKIRNATPSEVIILFDRDPKGKALFRLDQVTDSERASYMIANELRNVGVNVKIASLPDIYHGGKVGLDDLILDKGKDFYLKSLDQAVSIEQFAKDKNIDTYLTELTLRKNKIRSIVAQFERAMNSTLGSVKIEDYEILQKLKQYYQILEEDLHRYLELNYSIVKKVGKKTEKKVAKGISDIHPSLDVIRPVKKIFTNSSASSIYNTSTSKNSMPQTFFEKILTKDEEYEVSDYVLVLNLNKEQIKDEVSDSENLTLRNVFPKDEYVFLYNVQFRDQKYQVLVVKKDKMKPVAIVPFID